VACLLKAGSSVASGGEAGWCSTAHASHDDLNRQAQDDHVLIVVAAGCRLSAVGSRLLGRL